MNIYTLDLNFQNVPQATAAYLVVGDVGPILVETGPGSTLPTLLEQIAAHGYAPADIKHLLVTHIHLDHAGAAGWWAQQGTQVYVHHIGAPHLIDPARLLKSATRIYGDMMDTLWGETVPAPAENVTAIGDGDTIQIGGLTFVALETPGHASHHHTYQLGDIAFIGDAAGLRLPDTTFIDLPAPPPEFNLDVWQQTVDRLLAHNFTQIYPTHFGPVTGDPAAHLTNFKALLEEATTFVAAQMNAGVPQDKLIANYETWNRQRALQAGISETLIHQYETANPLYMSVLGIMRYLQKRQA